MTQPIFGLNSCRFQTSQRNPSASDREPQISFITETDTIVRSILSSLDSEQKAWGLAMDFLGIEVPDIGENLSENNEAVSEQRIEEGFLKTNGGIQEPLSNLYFYPETTRMQNRLDKPENKKFLVEEREKFLIELYNQGKSQCEIAKNLNINQRTISYWIAKLKRKGLLQDRLISKKERERILIELYNQGESQAEMGKSLGIAQCTISYRITKLKEKALLRDRLVSKKREQKIVMKLYHGGKSQHEIAKKLGKSERAISDWIVEFKQKGLLRDRLASKEEEERVVVELYHGGKSQHEIAKKLGRPQCTISYWIAKLKKKGIL